MCGIVGLAGITDSKTLRKMNGTLFHRGPDDEGYYLDEVNHVALAMRRLSILDPAHGHQPMSNRDGSTWIVFNGEIYNSPELRQRLEAAGHVFSTTNSDTEVLLHLYDQKQEDMLTDLNGMFAFVIYDRKRGLLFGARDPMGIKPLYYTQRPSRFAFSSELKSLFGLPWVDRAVNRESLFHYMSLRFVPGASSILQDVHRVPPGHWFRYDLQKSMLKIQQYWRLDFQHSEQRPLAEWRDLIRFELREAVRRWVLSDVPVGCSLSGGLDSSAIVGLLAEIGYGPLRTYSLGFAGAEEEEWNELPLARMVAKRWGTDHHELVLEPEDLLRDLLQMVWHLDEPYGGGLPSWYIFKFMRQHVTVALIGTGGDELFGDYGRFSRFEAHTPRAAAAVSRNGSEWAALREMAWRPVAGLVRCLPDGWLDPRRKHEWMHWPSLGQDPFRWYYFNSYYYFPDEIKRESVFSIATDKIPDTSPMLEACYEASGAVAARDALAYVGLTTQLPEEFLLMTDRFSMAHSLEARVPFLDHAFVKLMCRIPAEVRTKRGDLKYLFKLAVGDLLPPELLHARKRGFVIPIGPWLRGPLRPLAERMLAPERLASQGLFRPEFYNRYVRPHLEGRVDYHAQVWTALMFQLWHLLFIEERLTEAPSFSWQDL